MKNFFNLQKMTGILLLIFCASMNMHAETRFYYARGGDLPTTAGLTAYDMRDGSGHATINQTKTCTLNVDFPYNFYVFNSNWFIAEHNKSGEALDMSAISNLDEWFLVIKMATNCSAAGRIRLNANPSWQFADLALPRDSTWTTYKLKLSTAANAASLSFTANGPSATEFFAPHMDGTSGTFFAIDFAYLTNDTTAIDEGTAPYEKAGRKTAVEPDPKPDPEPAVSKRFYYARGGELPSVEGVTMVDMRPDKGNANIAYNQMTLIDTLAYPAWQLKNSWFSFNQTKKTNVDMSDVTNDWFFVYKVSTTSTVRPINVRLNNGISYKLTADNMPNDGSWKIFKMKLSESLNALTFNSNGPAADPFFQLHADGGSGYIALDYAYLTNDTTQLDPGTAGNPTPTPDPEPTPDPDRIYLLNDGTALPTNITCVDYRLDTYAGIKLAIGGSNTLARDAEKDYLSFTTANTGWWSFDLQAQGDGIDLSKVNQDWYLKLKLKTEVTRRPINIILYTPSQTTYTLTTENFPVETKNGAWQEIVIPMSAYSAFPTFNLSNYTSGNVFSLHADGAGVANALVEVEYLYFTTEAPDPGPSTLLSTEKKNVVSAWFINDNLVVTNLNTTETNLIQIMNFNGQIIFSEKSNTATFCKTMDLPNGIYIIDIIAENGCHQKGKVIK